MTKRETLHRSLGFERRTRLPMAVRAVRLLWKATPDALVLTDESGTVRAANPAYIARHGLAARLLVGKSIAFTYPVAERQAAMRHYRAVFASRSEVHAYPLTTRWRDDPDHVVESSIAFATQWDGQSFMLSSVRLLSEPTSLGTAAPPPGAMNRGNGPGRRPRRSVEPAAILNPSAGQSVLNAVNTWSVDIVFGRAPAGNARPSPT